VHRTAFLLSLFLALAANAEEKLVGIRASDAWALALPPVSQTGAAYLTLVNDGAETQRLVSASGEIADRVEIHNHVMDGGVMKMRPVEHVEVEPGSKITFEPGGLHVMLIGLREPLVAGESFVIDLQFDDGGSLKTEVSIRQLNSQ